ncbi:winged helix-turn-helix domain-containing protein [Nocardioides sp. NPDC057772]|uniref:winged helix-turn-helix domain-containing protein n=1 Tax=Nocardioides sp. NPDC057772 TaxID=3346245 RepID=UPI00366E762E
MLIEPDEDEAVRVEAELSVRGVRVVTFTTPWHALAHLGAEPAAVVVVSVRLGPLLLGEIVEAIRDETDHLVLIAYAPDDTETIGPAVAAGGRPLVVLPYDTGELIRVIGAVLPSLPPPTEVRIGRLSMVPEWQDARVDDTSLDLSPLEFRVLVELVRRDGRAATRDALVAAAWPEVPNEPNNLLTAAIKRVRHKFELLGVHDTIETIRGVGYRINTRAFAPRGQAGKTPISAMSRSTRIEISSTIRRTS